MPAGLYDITIEQGTTFSRVLTYRDANGALVNLTGFTARMDIRSAYETATPALQLTTANSRITLGGALGTVTLTLDATTTASLTASSYVYDLELISSGGLVTRLVEGTVTVTREVTR